MRKGRKEGEMEILFISNCREIWGLSVILGATYSTGVPQCLRGIGSGLSMDTTSHGCSISTVVSVGNVNPKSGPVCNCRLFIVIRIVSHGVSLSNFASSLSPRILTFSENLLKRTSLLQ